jgi:hypothetical protein
VHRLLERRAVVLLVKVVDVDVVGGEPAQAALHRSHHPFARQSAAVRPAAVVTAMTLTSLEGSAPGIGHTGDLEFCLVRCAKTLPGCIGNVTIWPVTEIAFVFFIRC